MTLLILLVITFSVTCEIRPGELVCDNGDIDFTESSSCMCEDNDLWDGIKCQMCLSDDSCPETQYCDKSLVIGSYKRYECSIYKDEEYKNLIGDKMLIYCGNETCSLEMWGQQINEEDPADPKAEYYKTFECTLYNITGWYNDDVDTITVESSRSVCECIPGSVYCDTWFVMDTIENMKGGSKIDCNMNTAVCEIKHSDFPGTIPLICRGAGCLYKKLPDIGNFTTKTIILEIGWQGIIIDLLCILLIIVIVLLFIQLCINNCIKECYVKRFLYYGCKAPGNKYEIQISIDEYLVRNHNYSLLQWIFCKMCCNFFMGFVPKSDSHDIEASIKNKGKEKDRYNNKYIPKIKNLVQIIKPGVYVVLGPSGTGKTIYTNLLKNQKMCGKKKGFNLTCNNFSTKNFPYNLISSMSEQRESPSDFFTVDEEIDFSCALRNPFGQRKTNKICWGLFKSEVYNNCRIKDLKYTLIGSETKKILSGGEKKRVEFAREVLAESGVLIMDEPFRGVDRETILNMLKIIKKYRNNKTGKITVFTMHTPPEEAYDYFDHILFFTEDCKLRIADKVDDIRKKIHRIVNRDKVMDRKKETLEENESMFEEVNIDRGYISTSISKYIFKHYKQLPEVYLTGFKDTKVSNVYMDDEKPLNMNLFKNDKIKMKRVPNTYRSKIVEIWYLLKREFYKSVIRYRSIFILQLLITLIVSIFVGVVYKTQGRDIAGNQNRMGFIFLLCLYFFMFSIKSIWLFEENKITYVRELISGYYSKGSLYVAKTLFNLAISCFLHPLILSVVNYWIIGLKQDRFFYFIVILIYVAILSELQSAIIGIVSGWVTTNRTYSKIIGIMIFTCVLAFNSLTSGLLLNRTTLYDWMNFLGYFSYWKAANEALMINEFAGTRITIQIRDSKPIHGVPGEYWLEELGMNKINFEADLAILITSVVIFFLVGYFLFKRLYYVKK